MAGQLTGRLCAVALVALAMGCGGRAGVESPEPVTLPLPVMALAGQPVTVYPVTMVLIDPSLEWDVEELGSREARLQRADSVLAATLVERAPEVDWVMPDALREAAARTPGMLSDPDRMGTAVLRNDELKAVPFPLISEMRTLTAVAGDRYAFVPAAIGFERDPSGQVLARVIAVIPDLRTGQIRWRSVAIGRSTDPWRALASALIQLAPPLQ